MPPAKHNLKPEDQAHLMDAQCNQLRAERFQHQMNIARWEAIPPELQDGSEASAIEQSTRAIAVIEAQIDALAAMIPTPNRAQRRNTPKR